MLRRLATNTLDDIAPQSGTTDGFRTHSHVRLGNASDMFVLSDWGERTPCVVLLSGCPASGVTSNKIITRIHAARVAHITHQVGPQHSKKRRCRLHMPSKIMRWRLRQNILLIWSYQMKPVLHSQHRWCFECDCRHQQSRSRVIEFLHSLSGVYNEPQLNVNM